MNQPIQNIQDTNGFHEVKIESQKINEIKIDQMNPSHLIKPKISIVSSQLGFEVEQPTKIKIVQNKRIIKQTLPQRPISFSNVNFISQDLNTHDMSAISFKDLDITKTINFKNVIKQHSSQGQDYEQQQRDKIIVPRSRLPYTTFGANVSFNDNQEVEIPHFQEIEDKNQRNQIVYDQEVKKQVRNSYQSQFNKQVRYQIGNQENNFKIIRSETISGTKPKFGLENKTNQNTRRNTSSNLILSSKNLSLIMDSSVNIENTIKNQRNRTNTDTLSIVHLGKKMQSQAIIRKEQNKYHEITFRISDNVLQIDNMPLLVNKIFKVKIFPHNEEVKKHAMIKILARMSKHPIIFGLKRTKYGDYPLSFYTFSKIIIKRLKQFGIHHTTDWQLSQKKPNIFLVPNLSANRKKQDKQKDQTQNQGGQQYWKTGFKKDKKIEKQIKKKQSTDKQKPKAQKSSRHLTSSQNSNDFHFCASKQQAHNGHQFKLRPAKTYIHGIIYKKSKYLSHWQRRYIIINELGIYSYHNESQSNFSIAILSEKIKQLWTNFGILYEEKIKTKKVKNNGEIQQWEYKTTQVYEPKQIFKAVEKIQDHLKDEQKLFRIYLIIKIKHSYGQKVEFAIPVCNFDAESEIKNWLYAFFKILPSLKK